jgi:hypothetical protein
MLTNDDISEFYKAVERLNLKFPVADISRATEEDKGNVSKYLKKKLEPSEGFIKKFYEAFPAARAPQGNEKGSEKKGSEIGNNTGAEKITFTKEELVLLFRSIANETSSKVENEMKATQKTQEKHNDFLQGLVTTNLKDTLQAVQDAHHELLTHIKAFERWEALRRTNGDKKKAKALLAELGTIVGDVDSELTSIGSPSALSNQSSD